MKVLGRIGASVLVVLFLTTGLSYGQSAAEQHLTKGVDYAVQGKFAEAKVELEKAFKVDPYVLFAEDGLKVIKGVVDKKIENKTAIHYFKGAAYGLNRQEDKAMAEYDKAIELNPRFAEVYYERANVYADEKQYDRAISDFNKAIKLNPRYAWAYHNRGAVYAQGKREYDRAISDYSKAIEINPRFGTAYMFRGFAYHYNGEPDKAREDLDKARSLGIQFPPGILHFLGKP